MSDKRNGASEQIMSDFEESATGAENLRSSRPPLGQHYPSLRSYPCPQRKGRREAESDGPLGAPMTIEGVARLLGCSPWTVRQRYLRQGLPHLQASDRGKLVFFREQVIAWVEKRQERKKGGIPR